MTKQLLFYESAVPMSATRHGRHSLDAGRNYAFSAGVNAVPLMAAEILRAATEYAIVFSAAGDEMVPAVILGVKGDQNLYLGPDAQWDAKYIPAYVRRYPFVFSASADKKSLTLCIDEAHPGLNTDGRGQRLFGDDGKPTPYVERVLEFLKQFQLHFMRTLAFGRRLKAADILEPMQARVKQPDGSSLSLTGFFAVNRTKLRALPPEKLAELARTDELELLYLHLYSMRNFADVKDRLIGTLPAEADESGGAGSAGKPVTA